MPAELVALSPDPAPKTVPDRIPPHDVHAEAAVLSSILLDPSAYDQVADLLKAQHFYGEAHRRIYEAAGDVHEAEGRVDEVLVATKLRDTGRLAQVGGMAYLTEVIAAAPAVENVRKYAQTVFDTWRVREAMMLCQRFLSRGYIGYGSAREYIGALCDAVQDLAGLDEAKTGASLQELIAANMRTLIALRERGSNFSGTPTGLDRLDRLTSGLHNKQLIILAGRPGMGKAQPLDAGVLTPQGWATMGDLRVGDRVIGSDGRPHAVLGVYDRGVRDVFRVRFDDGTSTLCCGEHLWHTRTRSERRTGAHGAVRSTDDIARTITRCRSGGLNHSVSYVAPVHYEGASVLPIHPYLLGVWLGDGSGGQRTNVTISNPEADVIDMVRASLPDGDEVTPITDGMTARVRKVRPGSARTNTLTALDAMGLSGCESHEKFIPHAYQLASVEDRVSLLQGLCDTDGYVTTPGHRSIEYTTVSPRLRDGILELVRGLGGRATWTPKSTSYTYLGEKCDGRLAFRMILSFPCGGIVPVRSAKHRAKYVAGPQRITEKFIVAVEPAGTVPVRCIRVDADDHLYVTDGFNPTHNTALAMTVAMNVAFIEEPRDPLAPPEEPPLYKNAVFVASLEMGREELTGRALSSEAKVDGSRMRTGMLAPSDWSKLSGAVSAMQPLRVHIDDQPAMTIAELRAKVRRYQSDQTRAGNRLSLVVVDYLQLMRGPDNAQSREQEVGACSRGLKQLSKELDVPVIALAQLNRQSENRGEKNKRPQLSDLRESGSLEQDADAVIFIYRDDYYNKESGERGITELIVAKQRNGPTDTVKVRWDAQFTRFDNLPDGEEYDRGS